MTKEDVAQSMKSQGYDAYIESGVIMVRVTDLKKMKDVKTQLNNLGYNASYGVIERKESAIS